MEKINIVIPSTKKIDLDVGQMPSLKLDLSGSKSSNNYNTLTNKPSINGVTLIGDKTDVELKLQGLMNEITAQDIDKLVFGG